MLTIINYDNVTSFCTTKTLLSKKLFSAKCYQIDEFLIDSGIVGNRELCLSISPPKAVCFTHAHHDHIGNTAKIMALYDSKVYGSEEGVRNAASIEPLPFFLRMMTGNVPPFHSSIFPEKLEGEELSLEMVHTPGHCDDHVCYYVPSLRYIFSGDLVLAGTTTWISDEVNIWKAIASIKKISRFKIDIIFPGHGGPFHEPKEVLKQKIDNLTELGKTVLEMHDSGLDEKTIRDKVLGKEEIIAFLSQGKLSKLNLVRSFLFDRKDASGL
ncbi:MAG: MBL fold metallo-hydrolase [Candidatus Methanofastidiosia archaeon]